MNPHKRNCDCEECRAKREAIERSNQTQEYYEPNPYSGTGDPNDF